MSVEHVYAPTRPPDGAGVADLGSMAEPGTVAQFASLAVHVDDGLVEAASDLIPGKALELGCANAQDALWLAQRGWTVTAVDGSPEAVEETRRAAVAAGLTMALHVGELSSWRPTSRFDLVVSSYSMPARGMGRSRMLETAVAAVAPGGTIVISELDISLHRSGRMAEKHLVSVEELERYLGGFRITRAATRMILRLHGYEEQVMPVTYVVASRRTDLRTF